MVVIPLVRLVRVTGVLVAVAVIVEMLLEREVLAKLGIVVEVVATVAEVSPGEYLEVLGAIAVVENEGVVGAHQEVYCSEALVLVVAAAAIVRDL